MAYTLYEGPSMLDGGPIFAAVSGIDHVSTNRKTGHMAHIWYMRSDVPPIEAVHTGLDVSQCGACILRGDGTGKGRSCYVTLLRGPNAVYKAYRGGFSKPLPHLAMLATEKIRLGAYGDPASVPTNLTKLWAESSYAFTGYTHQWRTCDPALKRWLMASCDNEEDYYLAKSMGWRTFRIKAKGEIYFAEERNCPASPEGGHKTVCAYCLRCGGTDSSNSRDVAINVHGTGKKHFLKLLNGEGYE